MRRMADAGKRGKWRDVIPALDEMLERGFVRDGRPFTVAIKALGNSGQTTRALKLLEVRVVLDLVLLSVLYSLVIDVPYYHEMLVSCATRIYW